jgi:hypothetical protein
MLQPGGPSTGHPSPAGYPPAGGGSLALLRSNKLLLHVGAGTLGGILGALLAELVPTDWGMSDAELVVAVGLWAAVFAGIISMSLFISDMWHQRRRIRPGAIAIAWLVGAGAGFVAGAVAQAVFLIEIDSFEFKNYVLRTVCWGIAGLLIGAPLARTVPNFGLIRGGAAGFIGGCVGGILFVLIANEMPDRWGRVCGIGVLGLALGLAMYAAEAIFREASLVIYWAPDETSQVSLGTQPVTIGGDLEDDVHVPGLPANVSTVVLFNGQIIQIDNYSGARTALRHGSQMQIGPIVAVVQARH